MFGVRGIWAGNQVPARPDFLTPSRAQTGEALLITGQHRSAQTPSLIGVYLCVSVSGILTDPRKQQAGLIPKYADLAQRGKRPLQLGSESGSANYLDFKSGFKIPQSAQSRIKTNIAPGHAI